MSAISDHTRTGSAQGTGQAVPVHAVPAHARELAARLSVLFEQDRGIVMRLSSAQRRLRLANDRLSSPATVLAALGEIHWQIHHAFCEYQAACEERRQLAVDVGELATQLTDALCAAGFDRQQARRVDVHQLARSRALPASSTGEGWR